MTGPPDFLLDPPPIRIMDALLDILRAMSLTGGIFLEAEFTAPWCVTSRVGPEDCRPFLAKPAHVIAYHYVGAGRLLLQVGGQPPVSVSAGEIVVLPRNDEHTLGSAVNLKPISADDLIQPAAKGGLARIVYGGGGERTRVFCGFLGTDVPDNPLLGVLPKVLKLDANESMAGDWIESSFRFAAQELTAGQIGSPAILTKLAELLFMEAVRRYFTSLPLQQGGWLAGLRDPFVGRALALMHGKTNRRWTVDALAREAGLSRSAFAERFTVLTGHPPMRYLTWWRIQSAAQRLRDSDEPITRIAFEVGYDSEAAFNRAFKRAFGVPPATWRKRNLG